MQGQIQKNEDPTHSYYKADVPDFAEKGSRPCPVCISIFGLFSPGTIVKTVIEPYEGRQIQNRRRVCKIKL